MKNQKTATLLETFTTIGCELKINRLLTSAVTAIVATTGAIAGAEAVTIRNDRYDWQYRNLASYFPSVGRIGLNSQGWCSGSLISSTWVLTAAHCIDPMQGQSATFTVGGGRYTVTNAIGHRGWLSTSGNVSAGFDIALLKLKSTVQNVIPAALFANSNEDMQVGTYVGFGATGTGLTGEILNDGAKRAGQNIIGLGSRLGYSDRLLVSDFDSPYNANPYDPFSIPLDLESNLGHGDSGGGLFINGMVAGVHSFIDPYRQSAYGALSASTRVSSFTNWIGSVASRTWSSYSTNPWTGSTPVNQHYTFASFPILDQSYAFDDWDPNNPHQISISWDDSEVIHEEVPEPSTVGIFSIAGLLSLLRLRKRSNTLARTSSPAS